MKHNLIGISGKIGAGKDEVGKIIQYLAGEEIANEDVKCSYEEWLKDYQYDPQVFEIKKFADKLKDIVCLLINCTREDLENPDFKNKELGEEWTVYEANYIDTYSSFTKIFVNNKDRLDWINSLSDPFDCRGQKDIKLTPRLLLQLIGTEGGRMIIHPNIWVNATFADYKGEVPTFSQGTIFNTKEWKGTGYCHECNINILNKELEYYLCDDCCIENKYKPNWIITDVRFPNECKAIKDKGGIIIRIDHPCKECGVIRGHKMIPHEIEISKHHSETALDEYQNFDYTIDNDGTIEELIKKVKKIIL